MSNVDYLTALPMLSYSCSSTCTYNLPWRMILCVVAVGGVVVICVGVPCLQWVR